MGNIAALPPRSARDALDQLFASGAASRVCVVVAAAGWGKTTAVRSWPVPTTWVSHRPATGTAGFTAGLLEALRPHAGPAPDDLPDPAGRIGPAAYAAAVCDWLRASLPERLAVVVDDAHELSRTGGAVRIIEELCRQECAKLQLVLLSRRELPFSLTRLHGQGQVTEIRAPALALGPTEIAALLRPESAGPAMLVWERTAGWPAVVREAIAALSGSAEAALDVLDRLLRPGEPLHRYLLQEIVGPEPEPVRHLMRWLAVLGTVDAASVAATGIADAPALLADLVRRGLVRRLPGREDRWSLQRPLQDYFDQERVLPAAERAALHGTAAIRYAANGAAAQALRHAAAAGNADVCRTLLVQHGARLVNGGQPGAVLDERLPRESRYSPAVRQVTGQARQVRGEWALAAEDFRLARCGRDRIGPALAWRLGTLAFDRGEFGAVLELRHHTHAVTGSHDGNGNGNGGPDALADQARWFALLAAAHRMIGDYPGCRADVVRAEAIARRSGDPAAFAAVHAVRAALAAADGDRRQADADAESALAAAEQAGDRLLVLRTSVLRAGILGGYGRPRDALAVADTAVRLGERCEDVVQTALALTERAGALGRTGILDGAVADLETARDALQRTGSRLLARPLCGLGDVYRTRGQLARARAVYEQALALAEPFHDVLGMGAALTGLARVRAADDLAVARRLAQRAVDLGEGVWQVPGLLTRGWVAAVAGDRAAALADAGLAAANARRRGDEPGLAEALLLEALCEADQVRRDRALAEATEIFRETGCRVEQAVAELVASRQGTASDVGAAVAVGALRNFGVELRSPRPAGPLALLAGASPTVSIRALGPFQVSHNGQPVGRPSWQSRKARQLVKILVARRRPVAREQLMEMLWPDAEPSKAANRLSVLLSGLRDVLQPEAGHADAGPLVTDGSGVWLDRTLVDVDVERFLEQADAALDAHRHGREDTLARLVSAEAAHTGDFLEDEPYQEWVEAAAEEVRATHVALLRALVFRMREAGAVDDVVRYALRLLVKDPYDEQAHCDLVDVLLDAGRHGEARRRYRLYVKAMAELGVEPRAFGAGRRGRARRGS